MHDVKCMMENVEWKCKKKGERTALLLFYKL